MEETALDVVLTILTFLYASQAVLVFFTKCLEKKNAIKLAIVGVTALIAYLIGGIVFTLVALFYMIFWSRACRLSDYGFSYHFLMIFGAGLVFGPVAGIFFGLVPRLFIPYLRPDIAIIEILVGAILLVAVGVLGGVVGHLNPGLWINAAIWVLVGYNMARFITLFGKLPIQKVTIPFAVNIALNYYLITNYLLKFTEYLAG